MIKAIKEIIAIPFALISVMFSIGEIILAILGQIFAELAEYISG